MLGDITLISGFETLHLDNLEFTHFDIVLDQPLKENSHSHFFHYGRLDRIGRFARMTTLTSKPRSFIFLSIASVAVDLPSLMA